MLFAYVEHGFDKVAAVFAEYPCDPNNEVFFKGIRHSKLALQLGLSVYIQRRIVFAVRLPGLGALSVEHIVR